MSGKRVIGGVLLLLGIGFLLQQLDLLDFGDVIGTWWPLLLILLGLYQMGANRRFSWTAAFLVLLGSVFLLSNVLGLPAGFWDLLWPVLLILGGLALLFGRRNRRARISDADVNRFVAFGGIEAAVDARPFRGGSLSACFGGIELDLTRATLPPEGATIDCFACFGGIDLTVPADWRVEATGLPLFGGFSTPAQEPASSSTAAAEGTGPVLRVTGTALFGGVEVTKKVIQG